MQIDLRGLILADATVSAALGGGVSWNVRPQASAVPSITLTLVSGGDDYTFGGRVTLKQARVQADCWAKTYEDARSVSIPLKTLLSGYSGTFGNTVFHGIFLVSETGFLDAGGNDAEDFHRVSFDFIVNSAGA